jgi:hypothetical protein
MLIESSCRRSSLVTRQAVPLCSSELAATEARFNPYLANTDLAVEAYFLCFHDPVAAQCKRAGEPCLDGA